MIGEYMCLLEEKGITFRITTEDNSPLIKIDAPYLKRLFDNIFINIRKYSDYSKPVDITYHTTESKVELVISNYINKTEMKLKVPELDSKPVRRSHRKWK